MMQRMDPLVWNDPILTLLDQRALPAEVKHIACTCMEDVREAIVTLAVRGAPLIGVAAAYAMVLAWREVCTESAADDRQTRWERKARHLTTARPTAVNLGWAVRQMNETAMSALAQGADDDAVDAELRHRAQQIEREDVILNDRIGENGARIFSRSVSILTHCNAGALATAGIGTALGIIRKLQAAGRLRHVFMDETRPLLQGARLTATELCAERIPCTLICDNMAAAVLRSGKVDAVIVGADRICANGDTANKIGTYGLAVLAAYHDVPLYIASPFSTFDFTLHCGDEIVIEERGGDEVRYCGRSQVAPAEVAVYNPAFDVTPASLITGIITERGVLRPPFSDSIARFQKEVFS